MQIGTIISTTVLAILLIVCLTVSSTVIVILVKTKLKIQAELIAANRALADQNKLKSGRLSVKQLDVDTSDNIAYSKSSGLQLKHLDVDTRSRDNVAYSRSDELSIKQRDVDTSDNVAYGMDVIG